MSGINENGRKFLFVFGGIVAAIVLALAGKAAWTRSAFTSPRE